MRKKIEIFIFAIIVAFSLLSSCSNANDKKSKPAVPTAPVYEWGKVTGETLTVWGERNDLKRPYLMRAFKNYEEATGNIIKTVPLSADDLIVKVPNAFNQADAEKPDILLSYGGTNIENLKPDENFYHFTDAPWVDDLTDTAINLAIYNANIIGLPYWEASVSGTLYNKALFKRYHLEIPKTQDEFLAVCETLLQNGVTPMYLPYAGITMLLYQFPMDSIVQDSEVLSGLNSGALSYSDIPEMYSIINWYKTMADRGYFGKHYTENDWDGMDAAMKGNEYAMMLCWDTWVYTNFTGNPDNLGLMPAFMGTPENGCFEGANVLLVMANKNGKKLDAVLDFTNFLADPCNYNISFADLYTAPMFKKQIGSITTPQYVEAEQLINKLFYDSTAGPRIRGFSQVDAKYIQMYMQNECTAKECLDSMNDARLERAGIVG